MVGGWWLRVLGMFARLPSTYRGERLRASSGMRFVEVDCVIDRRPKRDKQRRQWIRPVESAVHRLTGMERGNSCWSNHFGWVMQSVGKRARTL